MVRKTYSVLRETHRYFIEELTNARHIKVLFRSRLIKFQEMLEKSERNCINMLAKISSMDSRTIHGNNLKQIERECKETNLTFKIVKESMKYCQVPLCEEWKIPLVKDFIQTKEENKDLTKQDNIDLNNMIFLLTTT